MKLKMIDAIDKLADSQMPDDNILSRLIITEDTDVLNYLTETAVRKRKEVYGNTIYIRGLIEFTNICKNNCYYCGIRASSGHIQRYRLTPDEILDCCENGYNLGFRTFVLQGGEDLFWNDDNLTELVRKIRSKYPDCAITLSVGERSRESYEKLFEAGADRYLLRHESATKSHYEQLHPAEMNYENRIRALLDLKEIGYQTGCGFMVGSPYQTISHLIADLKFIKKFEPAMVGIGPFIPASKTPFAREPRGSAALTVRLLSIIRIMIPSVLLPATTALGTVSSDGRTRGILAGANVIMPNLSPGGVRKKYSIYDNKLNTGCEAAEQIEKLATSMKEIGYEIAVDRGDNPDYK